MRIKQIFYYLAFLCSACSLPRGNQSINHSDGYSYYKEDHPALTIQLLGDYFFQPLTTMYFRDIHKSFLRYSTIPLSGRKPEILYSAHTIVHPYYSAVCFRYTELEPGDSFFASLNEYLKEKLNSSFKNYTTLELGTKKVYKISYQLTNAVTRIDTQHTEYFFKKDNHTYRLFFWTAGEDDKVMGEEAVYIITNIRFE